MAKTSEDWTSITNELAYRIMTETADWITLESRADGFALSAWHSPAQGERRGGLVLIQEIFGITEDIKRVCAEFSAEGYEVLAPSLFDRIEPRVQIPHDQEGVAKGRDYTTRKGLDELAGDVQAAIDRLSPGGPVFLTGFCYGGFVAWIGACRCTGLNAASCYYGRLILEHPEEQPRCPTILHWGRNDSTIPVAQVEAFMASRPELVNYLYDAGHGFVSSRPTHHDPEATRLAMSRTLELFRNAG